MGKKQKRLEAARDWLKYASTSYGTTVSFGENCASPMHGGGTSRYPHCRPYGIYNSGERAWKVKLEWHPQHGGPTEVLVEMFTLSWEREPTKEEVYAALIEKVNAKLKSEAND